MPDELPTREKLLANIRPGLKLTKNLFLQIYGYDISTPGFAYEAIAKLKDLGCSKAGKYYEQITSEWKEEREKMLQKGVNTSRKQREAERLQQMSNKDLIMLLESLTEGI